MFLSFPHANGELPQDGTSSRLEVAVTYWWNLDSFQLPVSPFFAHTFWKVKQEKAVENGWAWDTSLFEMLSVIANVPNNEVQIFHCNYKLLAQRDVLEHISISKKYLSEQLFTVYSTVSTSLQYQATFLNLLRLSEICLTPSVSMKDVHSGVVQVVCWYME